MKDEGSREERMNHKGRLGHKGRGMKDEGNVPIPNIKSGASLNIESGRVYEIFCF